MTSDQRESQHGDPHRHSFAAFDAEPEIKKALEQANICDEKSQRVLASAIRAAFESGRAAGRGEGLEEAAKVVESDEMKRSQWLPKYKEESQRVPALIRALEAKRDVGTPTASKVQWNYGEIARRMVPIQEMPDPAATPKYICPMKRPSGAPKNCGECKRNGGDEPGECYCCGAKLILSSLTVSELRAGAEDPYRDASDCLLPTAPPTGKEPKP